MKMKKLTKKERSFKSVRDAIYVRHAEKTEKGEELGLYKKAGRLLSVPFTKLLLYFPITANMVSFAGVLFTVLAAYPFALGGLKYGLVGLLLMYVGDFCDFLDGPIARIRKTLSKYAGHFLTHFYHQGAFSFVFIGLGLGVFKTTGNALYLYLGFAASFFHLFTVYTLEMRKALLLEFEYDQFKDAHDGSKIFIEKKSQHFILKMFTLPVYFIRVIILVGFLLNVVDWLVIFYGIFLPFRAILFFGNTYINLRRKENQ
jgi:1L-myo-inositol 1-phosphate cytidylyltransferase / CDP-L-myo-inositol myo-inositolphosphotransferase